MSETPSGLPSQPQPPAVPAPESGHDRLMRGLKTAGIGFLLFLAGIGGMVYMGSQGLTGSAAIAVAGVALVGVVFVIKGVVLAIWGAVARSRA